MAIDAATSPCFNVLTESGIRRVSLVEILSAPNEDMRFVGPNQFLESCQLMLAASITADVIGDSVGSEEAGRVDLTTVCDYVLDSIQKNPMRFSLDGVKYRYLQVNQPEDRTHLLNVPEMEETFFPNFAATGSAKATEGVSFGYRPNTSKDGFCPTCALLGLNFAAKFSGGTGGKVAGLWKAGALTYPIYTSLRDTVLVNALSWVALKIAGLTLADKDPWADDTYLNAVVNSGPWQESFRTKRHIRSFTPWALWLNWEYKPHSNCTLCGLYTDHVATTMQAPKKIETGYTGKLGWPKVTKGKNQVIEVVPSPWTPLCQDKDEGYVTVKPNKTSLLSQVESLLSGSDRACALDFRRKNEGFENDEGFHSVLVASIFNHHKGVDSYDFCVHINLPTEDGTAIMVAKCQRLYKIYEDQKNQLSAGVFSFFGDKKDKYLRGRLMDIYETKALSFLEYLGPDGHVEWKRFLLRLATQIYQDATRHMYDTTSIVKTKQGPKSKSELVARGEWIVGSPKKAQT